MFTVYCEMYLVDYLICGLDRPEPSLEVMTYMFCRYRIGEVQAHYICAYIEIEILCNNERDIKLKVKG